MLVSSPSELVKMRPDMILICSVYGEEIIKQIKSMKLENVEMVPMTDPFGRYKFHK